MLQSLDIDYVFAQIEYHMMTLISFYGWLECHTEFGLTKRENLSSNRYDMPKTGSKKMLESLKYTLSYYRLLNEY